MEEIINNLPILIVNGSTLLVVVMFLIKVIARVFERTSMDFAASLNGIKDEIVRLRTDLRDVGTQTAVAVGQLTERVSRIEGKIEGIAMARAPEFSDLNDDEKTPVGGIPRPPSHGDNIFIDPELTRPGQVKRATPASGIPRLPSTAGTYSMGKPVKK